MKPQMIVKFIDTGREPQCPADPKFPNGVELDYAPDEPVACVVTLPYPAPRCGAYFIKCEKCGMSVACTAAGRRDDPRTVRIPCKTYGKN